MLFWCIGGWTGGEGGSDRILWGVMVENYWSALIKGSMNVVGVYRKCGGCDGFELVVMG